MATSAASSRPRESLPLQSLSPRQVAGVFLVLAFGYFLSSVLRAVTATLAPTLTRELALGAGDLGLLAGAYFLGFALTQLPLGRLLDRYGPARVSNAFLAVAVAGCIVFALAQGFWSLLVARLLCGIGVSACFMAPLTGFRRWFEPHTQLRANSWMLMVGSLGLLAATLPVQWALPLVGWRPLFAIMAALFFILILGIAWQLPGWPAPEASLRAMSLAESYAPVLRSRYLRRIAPLGLINYGGLVAVQTLWAGPWMTQVAGYSALEAATGLFAINLTMLVVFFLLGALNPALARSGFTAERLMVWGIPVGLAALAGIVVAGPHAGWGALAAFCALSSTLSVSHPALALAFPAHQAGQALAAFNLLLFVGAFAWQWGIGVLVDVLRAWNWSEAAAYQGAFGVFALVCLAGYLSYAVGYASDAA